MIQIVFDVSMKEKAAIKCHGYVIKIDGNVKAQVD